MSTKIHGLAALLLVVVLATACAQATSTPLPTTTALPVTVTSSAVATATIGPTPTEIPLPTVQSGCTDSALYVKDVSIPDNTKLKAGETFVKIWQLRNTGTCIWNIRYALVFVGGEQMGAAITTPLSETPPGETLDISVKLVAPGAEGAYAGLFELRNPVGRSLAIGSVTSIWVKITVGNVSSAAAPAATTAPVNAVTPTPNAACSPQQNDAYTNQLLSLLNNARAQAKLTPLNLNTQLNAAAQGHSSDMACNNFVGHTGSDGSSIHARVAAAGYAASYSEEIIYASGSAQDAFNWWMNDKTHREVLLNPNAVDVGIGYSYLPGTAYGSYYTVDFGSR